MQQWQYWLLLLCQILWLIIRLPSNPEEEGAIDLPCNQNFAILFLPQLEGQSMGQEAAGAAPGAGKGPGQKAAASGILDRSNNCL